MAVLILQLIIVVFKSMNFSYNFFFLLTKTCVKVSDIAQVIKNIFTFQGQNQMIHFTLFTFQMYSSSIRFQQKESTVCMNKQKNVEGDQT